MPDPFVSRTGGLKTLGAVRRRTGKESDGHGRAGDEGAPAMHK